MLTILKKERGENKKYEYDVYPGNLIENYLDILNIVYQDFFICIENMIFISILDAYRSKIE